MDRKRVSSASWSTKMPAVVFVTTKRITLSRIPDEIYDRLINEIFRVIGRRDGGFTAVRRKGFWKANFALSLCEAELRQLRVSIAAALAKSAKRG